MIENFTEKEANLKELVVKLIEERNLTDFELLNSLFTEIKEELKDNQKSNF